ncbi:MAG: hypothetical protein ACOYMH_10455 [Zwartia sp.]
MRDPVCRTCKWVLAALVMGLAGLAHSQVALQCTNDKVLPLPLEITLNEVDRSGTVKMQYSRQTKCEFLSDNWVYAADEIRFEFSIDLEDCAKHLKPLKAKLDRKAGTLFLAPAGGSGEAVSLACAKAPNGNKF